MKAAAAAVAGAVTIAAAAVLVYLLDVLGDFATVAAFFAELIWRAA